MIVLFSDFGLEGPYIGQVKAALHAAAPGVPLIDLFSDAPVCDPKASAYLLAAYSSGFPEDCVFLSVVDPGVGGDRSPVVLRTADHWFVGPDNGLFEPLIKRASASVSAWIIRWRPKKLSATFHGRDLFAPVAARIARGDLPRQGGDKDFEAVSPEVLRRQDWPDDLAEIVYIDHFGNAITGLRSSTLHRGQTLAVNGKTILLAKTFTSVAPGDMFCYENSNGLMEIAVNKGRGSDVMGIEVGAAVEIAEL